MTMTPIWNVRGVRLETRQKAKAAAAWTGMTIGEWVDRAVGVMAEDDLHTKLPKMRIAPEYPCGPEEVAAAEKIAEAVESKKVSAGEKIELGDGLVVERLVHGTGINSNPVVEYSRTRRQSCRSSARRGGTPGEVTTCWPEISAGCSQITTKRGLLMRYRTSRRRGALRRPRARRRRRRSARMGWGRG